MQMTKSQLAIHKFHNHNKAKGKLQNHGPIQWPAKKQYKHIMKMQQSLNTEYFNNIRDPKIAAAIQKTKQMLADSVDLGHKKASYFLSEKERFMNNRSTNNS